jgi:hypothetical protein
MNYLYAFSAGLSLTTVASLLAIWMDRANPTEDSIKNFLFRFFSASTKAGILQRILLLLGLVVSSASLLGKKPPYYLVELLIIFATVGVTSSLFKNFESNNSLPVKANLSIIGKIHIVLLLVGCIGVGYAFWILGRKPQLTELDNAMDIIAHLVTFIVSVSALLGETASKGKLTRQGQALIILIVVFSSISVLTSMDSSEKQNALEKAILETQGKANSLGQTLDRLNETSTTIKSNLIGMDTSLKVGIKKAVSPVLNSLNFHFGTVNKPDKGRVTLQLNGLADNLNIKDSVFKIGVGKIEHAQITIKSNESFIKSNQQTLVDLKNSYEDIVKQYRSKLDEYNQSLNQTKNSIESINSNFKEVVEDYDKIKIEYKKQEYKLQQIDKMLSLKKSLDSLVKTSSTRDSISTSEVLSIVKK